MKSQAREAFEKLESLRLSIVEQFDGLSDEQLNFKPDPDSWSLLQVIYHLMRAEAEASNYINKKLLGAATIKKAGISSRLRLMALNVALLLPIKYKAPKAFNSPPERLQFADMKAEWKEIRNQMRAIVDNNHETDLSKEIFKHPIAGRMSLKQAFEFMQNHIEHHMKQMDRIRGDANFPGK